MRGLLGIIPPAILIGAAISVGIAWGTVRWADVESVPRPGARPTATDQQLWRACAPDGYPPDPDRAVAYRGLGVHQLFLSANPVRDADDDDVDWRRHQRVFALRLVMAGWPRPALGSRIWWDADEEEYVTDGLVVIQRRRRSYRELLIRGHLPITPVWGGLLVNSTLFAIPVWVMLLPVPGILRRRRRWRAGRCPRCDVVLIGHLVRACRDCGWRSTYQHLRLLRASHVRFALACLLGGLVISVVTAWVLSMVVNAGRETFERRLTATERAQFQRDGFDTNPWRAYVSAGRRTGLAIQTTADDESERTLSQGVLAGWPRLCLGGRVVSTGQTEALEPIWTSQGALLLGYRRGWPVLVPYLPLGSGLLFNTAFFGATLWILMTIPIALRRRIRVRRARCLLCGYDLRTECELCPECGAGPGFVG